MPTISFHAPPALYKKFALAAKQRRVKPSQFARVAVEEKLSAESTPNAFPGVQRITMRLQELLEDEMDVRIAEQRLARRARGESKTYTGEEVWRELGLQD